MEKEFWHDKWQKNEIAFHENKPNSFLEKNIDRLVNNSNRRIFVPLCGKTLDISWLLSNGYSVVGCELNQSAIDQLFSELGTIPRITRVDNFIHYSAENIDIFVGDVFELSYDLLGEVNGVYDRAALVALPIEMRRRYTKKIVEVTKAAPQLLIVFEYDQSLIDGPPFSITREEIKAHYREAYSINLIEKITAEGGIRGECPGLECGWLLTN